MGYTPELSDYHSATLRRTAWALGKPMTKTIPAGLRSPGPHGQPRGWIDMGQRGRVMFGILLHFDFGKGILKETIRGRLA